MRTVRHAVAAALALAASAASAQLSNHAVAVESGVSWPAAGGGALASLAASATVWIGGEVEGIARVAFASAAASADRGAAPRLTGTTGLRVSLLPDPLRPQLQAEIGWTAGPGGERGVAIAVGAGAEWFPARDLSLAARIALRGPPSALAVEASLGAAAYF